jgi:hypothetical protein
MNSRRRRQMLICPSRRPWGRYRGNIARRSLRSQDPEPAPDPAQRARATGPGRPARAARLPVRRSGAPWGFPRAIVRADFCPFLARDFRCQIVAKNRKSRGFPRFYGHCTFKVKMWQSNIAGWRRVASIGFQSWRRPSKFGRHPDDLGYTGRRVDCLGKSIAFKVGMSPIEALQHYLRTQPTRTAYLSLKRRLLSLIRSSTEDKWFGHRRPSPETFKFPTKVRDGREPQDRQGARSPIDSAARRRGDRVTRRPLNRTAVHSAAIRLRVLETIAAVHGVPVGLGMLRAFSSRAAALRDRPAISVISGASARARSSASSARSASPSV